MIPLINSDQVKAKAVDANKNGTIDENDVFVLDDIANQIYDEKIQPLLLKAEIRDKLELYAADANFRLRSRLTVIEWETLSRNMDEWNKINAQIDATAKEAMDKIVEKQNPVSKSGKVVACADWGGIGISDGMVIKYAGIQMPSGGTDNKFSRIAALFSAKLLVGRIIRYELTGKKTGNTNEAYIYINEVCINEELVRRGYALAIRDESERAIILTELEEEAKEKNIGLWAYYPDQNPFGNTFGNTLY